jgi:hypothetical protein
MLISLGHFKASARVFSSFKIHSYVHYRRRTWARCTFKQTTYGHPNRAHLFLPRNAPAPYQVIAVMGGITIQDTIKRIEDFDYPYEFILRSGRAVLIPAYSGTLERGPSPYVLPANQERERALRWSMDLGRSLDYLETRPDIDVRNTGFYGLSLGVVHGVRMIAVEPRIKVAVFTSGGISRCVHFRRHQRLSASRD